MVLDRKSSGVDRFPMHIDAKRLLSNMRQTEAVEAELSTLANSDWEKPRTDTDDLPQDNALVEVAAGAFAGGLLGVMLGSLAGIGVLTVPGVNLLLLAFGTTGMHLVTAVTGAGIGTISGSLIVSALLKSERSNL